MKYLIAVHRRFLVTAIFLALVQLRELILVDAFTFSHSATNAAFFAKTVATKSEHLWRREVVIVGAKAEGDQDKKKKKKKKKGKFTINYDGIDEISSANEEAAAAEAAKVKAKKSLPQMGARSLKKKSSRKSSSTDKKLTKIERQRTANGNIDSSQQSSFAPKEDQKIQVETAKRGSKQVTIVRGMLSPFEDRKAFLKEIKKKLGGGGSLIDGVLELQGSHADKVVNFLKDKGYTSSKKVGK